MPASCKTQTGYKKRDLKGTRENWDSAAESGVCLWEGSGGGGRGSRPHRVGGAHLHDASYQVEVPQLPGFITRPQSPKNPLDRWAVFLKAGDM